MVYWGYVSQSTEQNELGLSESVTTGTSEEDIVKIDQIYSNTVANGLSNGAMPDTKKKKKPPFRSGKKYVETYSSPNAMALDPEQRVLHHINGKNKATVQSLKP